MTANYDDGKRKKRKNNDDIVFSILVSKNVDFVDFFDSNGTSYELELTDETKGARACKYKITSTKGTNMDIVDMFIICDNTQMNQIEFVTDTKIDKFPADVLGHIAEKGEKTTGFCHAKISFNGKISGNEHMLPVYGKKEMKENILLDMAEDNNIALIKDALDDFMNTSNKKLKMKFSGVSKANKRKVWINTVNKLIMTFGKKEREEIAQFLRIVKDSDSEEIILYVIFPTIFKLARILISKDYFNKDIKSVGIKGVDRYGQTAKSKIEPIMRYRKVDRDLVNDILLLVDKVSESRMELKKLKFYVVPDCNWDKDKIKEKAKIMSSMGYTEVNYTFHHHIVFK